MGPPWIHNSVGSARCRPLWLHKEELDRHPVGRRHLQLSTSAQSAGAKPDKRASVRGVASGVASTTKHSGASSSVERMPARRPSVSTAMLVCAPPLASDVMRSTVPLAASMRKHRCVACVVSSDDQPLPVVTPRRQVRPAVPVPGQVLAPCRSQCRSASGSGASPLAANGSCEPWRASCRRARSTPARC